MTSLVTADLHFSANPRDEYRFTFQKQFRNIVRKQRVNLALVLGDLTEAKDNHSAELVNRVVEQFYLLSKLCKVIVLKGNHDWLSDANNPFFQFLHRIDGITWVNTPTIIGPHLFLPHTHNHERDWTDIDWQGHDWVFAHNTFQGAYIGHGQRLDGIPLGVFPAGVQVISGDVHSPQKLGCVTYVGAPYRIDFGDDYEPRVLLLDGKIKKTIKCHGVQKRLIEVGSVDELKEITTNPGDLLKVRVTIKANQYDKWTEIRDKVTTWGTDNGTIINMVQPVITSAAGMLKKKAQTVQTDPELLTTYAKKQGVSEQTLRTGLWLMERTK